MVNLHAVHGSRKVVETLMLIWNTDAGSHHEGREDLDQAGVEGVGCKLQYPAGAVNPQAWTVCSGTGAEGSMFN
jgi:hypothetical protein